jgi:hypothetical protein
LSTGDILRWPHQFIPYRLLLTPDNTDATSLTVLANDVCLELLGTGNLPHLDGIKRAFFDTVLTTNTKVLVHDSQETVGIHQVKPISFGIRIEHFTGVCTAIADSPMDKPGFLIGTHNVQSFLQRDFL